MTIDNVLSLPFLVFFLFYSCVFVHRALLPSPIPRHLSSCFFSPGVLFLFFSTESEAFYVPLFRFPVMFHSNRRICIVMMMIILMYSYAPPS